ncbi:transposase [Cryobacterium sp. Y50]|uniref:IclR family transcriptional regulator domain-containing protein n=1 Tax=Cryobacterium sp. Y50 TaxID=2048286 RepID=UPI000CE4B0F2|nr:transposase [Cryobacterium sp. Y50]
MTNRRKFSAKFRVEAVELVISSGRPIAQVAPEIGVDEGTLGNWVRVWKEGIEEERGTMRGSGVVTVEKTLAILEIVAERGGASAKDVSQALGYPLPTVYRLLQALVQGDYLVHLKGERRFELGYKLDRLGVSLHRQIGVPAPVRAEIVRLHEAAQTAGYFAVYRGADVVVAYVVDSPAHPRLVPLNFGFHEAAHATAFGKILLAGMSTEQVGQYLEVHGTPRLTSTTITSRDELDAELSAVVNRGIAWNRVGTRRVRSRYDLRCDWCAQQCRDDRWLCCY